MVIATISSKGQITIPKEIREKLGIQNKGDVVGFEITNRGVLIRHLEIKESSDNFTSEEWKKLEKLANTKGKTYSNAKAFLKAINNL